MFFRIAGVIAVALLASCGMEDSQLERPPGTGGLFIIGGGARPASLMEGLIDRSGLSGADSICILGWASEEPDTAYYYAAASFAEAGHLACRSVAFPLTDEGRRALNDTKLIYITGGDQNRLMLRIDSAAVRPQLILAFRNGTCFAGTSAGAACMSANMITGEQLLQDEYTPRYGRLNRGNAVYGEGLGLLQLAGIEAIVDQHFIARSRYDRAITALFDFPGTEVWGIDESTAVWVFEGKTEVVGEGQVCRYHPVEAGDQSTSLIRAEGMVMDVLASGDRFSEPSALATTTRAPSPK